MSNEQEERNNQQNYDDLGYDPDVPIVHLPSPEHPHHPTEETHYSHHYVKRCAEIIRKLWPTRNRWIMIATLISAISTSVYAWYAYRQWKTMGWQLQQMIRASNQTERSIKIAEQANAEASENFIQGERPYIALNIDFHAKPGEVNNPATNGAYVHWEPNPADPTKGTVVFTLHIKNFGKTPAISLRLDRTIKIGKNAFQKWRWNESGYVGEESVAPGQDIFFSAVSEEISRNELETALVNDMYIVVFGHIDYEGLNGRSYWTEFCVSHLASGAVSSCPSHSVLMK